MRDVRGRCSLIPGPTHRSRSTSHNTTCLIPVRGRMAILVNRRLISNSRSIGSITGSHIRRCSVRGQSIWVLLDIVDASVLGLALPESALGRPSCVAVVGRGAEGTLFAAVLDETNFDEDGEEEEDQCDNSDRERSLLELACLMQTRQSRETSTSIVHIIIHIRIPGSEGRIHVAAATMRTTSQRPRNIDECSSEAEIDNHPNYAEECDASEKAHQQETQDGVDDCSTRDTLNGSNIGGDVQAMVVECGEEVGEYS